MCISFFLNKNEKQKEESIKKKLKMNKLILIFFSFLAAAETIKCSENIEDTMAPESLSSNSFDGGKLLDTATNKLKLKPDLQKRM